MDRGLIIRATSLQHLPLVMKRVKERFPRSDMDVLTHPNAIHSLNDWFKPCNIISYGSRGCFSVTGILKEGVWNRLRKKRYDFVVVPVENIHGSGYENVFKVALSAMPRKIIVVNKQGEITLKSFTQCLRNILVGTSLFPVSLVITLGFSVYVLARLASARIKRATEN